MSHYPTSAELASFRAATHNATIAEVERITGRPVMAFVHPSASPAFPSELRHGIGHSPDAERIWQRDGWSVGDAARREASRMRSRAFASVITEGQRAVYHGGSARNACLRERSEGLPVPIDHYHVSGAPLV